MPFNYRVIRLIRFWGISLARIFGNVCMGRGVQRHTSQASTAYPTGISGLQCPAPVRYIRIARGTPTRCSPMSRPVVVAINATLTWHYSQDRSGDGWVATCDALRLVAEGDTQNDLSESIHDLVNTLFHGLWKEGRLDAFLRDHGWRTAAPLPEHDGNVWFDVPVHLLPKANRHGEARPVH